MKELIELNSSKEKLNTEVKSENAIIVMAEDFLLDAHTDLAQRKKISMPIEQLSTLGAGVSSLLPSLRTVTQTMTVNTQGLYKLANSAVGDTLKVAKNGNFWGAYKTAEGASKFAQLQYAGPLTATTQTVAAINPATMMMAVALFSIEQKLSDIEEMQNKILSFMEIEKESQIEGNVETLMDLITKYKYNWDNPTFVSNSHMKVLDLQQNARQNIINYQKKVKDIIEQKKLITAQGNVKAKLIELRKCFSYYRLSLYTFALASTMEILLGGNFREEYITGIIGDISKKAMEYRAMYGDCSLLLEKMGKNSVEAKLLNGISDGSKVVGKFVGSIPIVKESSLDEFLLESATNIKRNAKGLENGAVKDFSQFSNPGTGIFTDRMKELVEIYNHTEQICFDDKNLYLITE